MSGAGDNRGWRRSGQANRQNQETRSGTSTPNRDGGRQQGVSGVSGNVWGGGKGKATGAGNAERQVVQPTPAQAEQQQNVSDKDFNAGEVKEYLKKRYTEAIADRPSAYYKVQGDSVAKRSTGPWGARGNMSHLMPNGQDFFTQLKKQLAALDQGKPS